MASLFIVRNAVPINRDLRFASTCHVSTIVECSNSYLQELQVPLALEATI